MRPASCAASSPKPQKKSTRSGPRIAPPVSWANTRRWSGRRRQRPSRGEEHRRAKRNRAWIDCDRTTCRERHAEGADRAVNRRGGVQGQLAKENVARVFVEQCRQRLRMLPCPLLDCLHRGAVGRELAAFDQDARDRAKRPAVLIGIAKAKDTAFGELHPPGALDLQEERLDRIVDENEHLALKGCSAGLDVRAGPVRDNALAVNATAQSLVLQFGVEFGEIDGQKIVRRARRADSDCARCARGCR